MTIGNRLLARKAKSEQRHRRVAFRATRRLFAVLLLGLGAPPALALTQVSSFGSNPGNLQMFKHVPSGMPSGAPLVVALHGCTQSASAYEASGWTSLANQYKFAVVYPQQQSGNNSNKCFNWFETGDITRGQGEALSIKQMVDKMKTDHGVDGNRVYVTGLSAGGFMTDVMLATYPDVFAGGAPVAGGPYKCATSMTAAFSCMSPGTNKTPTDWGNLARGGYSGYSGRKPIVSIWHGDADYTVAVMNLTEQMEQWTNYHGVDQTADTSNTVKGFPHKVYKTSGGSAVVESYTITGMGHGTPVDPGTATDQCGTAGAYILDVNICSSYYIAQFWGLLGSGGGGGGGSEPPPPSGGSTTFTSISGDDAYVKATSSGGSPAVGAYGSIALGRGTDGKFNRGVLSFDTSAIPDGATITKAYVIVERSSGSGDPWASSNSLVVDVKTGCLGSACTIGTDDWAASVTASGVASIAKFTSGTKASSNFSSAGLSAINKTGKTQLKLRFSSNQSSTAYIFIKEGTAAKLVVEYQ